MGSSQQYTRPLKNPRSRTIGRGKARLGAATTSRGKTTKW